MADTLTALHDPTASSYAGLNITLADLTYQAITAGAGIEAAHADVGAIKVKNTTGGDLTLKITVPTPTDSGLGAIGKSVTTKDYVIPANKQYELANMGAYKDSGNDQKIVFDASATGLSIHCSKPINPSFKG